MLVVGHIDMEKYSCVTTDIATDEVILTEERIAHIRQRHPGDYERYMQYIPEIVANPDYIIEDDRPIHCHVPEVLFRPGGAYIYSTGIAAGHTRRYCWI